MRRRRPDQAVAEQKPGADDSVPDEHDAEPRARKMRTAEVFISIAPAALAKVKSPDATH